MELRQALTQIAEIRQQMARGQIFRGYRAATTAFTGAVALVNGLLLTTLLPAPSQQASGATSLSPLPHIADFPQTLGQWNLLFVIAWVAAAALCVLVVGCEMVVRTRRSSSELQRQLTLLAVEQFVPSIVSGGLLTWVFLDFVPGQIWMLPGLWMILFSLGVFASARLLPRAVFGVAAFYLIAGIATLLTLRDGHAGLMNLCMGAVFGIGQFAIAGILYIKLERNHE